MKKILSIVSAIIFCGILFSSFTASLDGRAVVAESGVMPEGVFARVAGYLPGDSISVTNLSTKESVDVLVIGSLDSSEGISILLSPEAGKLLGMKKNGSNAVKIAKRSGQIDEHVSGTAVIGGSYSPSYVPETPAKEIPDSDNKTDAPEESVPEESYDSEIDEPIEESQNDVPKEAVAEEVVEPIAEPTAEPIAEPAESIEEPVTEPMAEPIEETLDVPELPTDEPVEETEKVEEKIDAETPSENIPSEKFSDESPEAIEDEVTEDIEEPALPSDSVEDENLSFAEEETLPSEKIDETDDFKEDSPAPSLPAEQYAYEEDAIKVDDFSEETPTKPFYDESDDEPTILNDETDLPKTSVSGLKETLVENEPDFSSAPVSVANEGSLSEEPETLFSEKTDEPMPEAVEFEENAVENPSESDTEETVVPLSEEDLEEDEVFADSVESEPVEEASAVENTDAPEENQEVEEEVPPDAEKVFDENLSEIEDDEPEDAILLPDEEMPSDEQNEDEEPLETSEIPSETDEVPSEEQNLYSESVQAEELESLESPLETEELEEFEETSEHEEPEETEEFSESEEPFENSETPSEPEESETTDDSLKSNGNVFDEPQVEENYEPIVLEPSLPNPPVSEQEPDENEKYEIEKSGDTNISLKNEINISETAVPDSNRKENSVPEKQSEQKVEKKSKDDSVAVPVQKIASLNKGWYIQIAILPDMASAKKLALQYQKNYPMTIAPDSDGKSFRVLVGRLSMDEYGTVLNRFKNYGYKGAFLRVVE